LPKEGEYYVWIFLKMVCFFIAVNTESGRCKASPERRGPLQVVSLVLQVIIWATATVGVVLVGESVFVEFQLIHNGFDDETSALRVVASMIFYLGNIFYLVSSFLLAVLTIHAKLIGKLEATKRRPKIETCSSICSPYNGLAILHHIQHRVGLIINLTTLLLCFPILTSETEFNLVPAHLWLCIPLFLLSLMQSVLSLLYMEEMALCGLGACCFYFLWVRRTPNLGQDATPVA